MTTKANNAGLKAVESAMTEQSETRTVVIPKPARHAAESMLHDNDKALDQVHEYALDRCKALEDKIVALKLSLENTRSRLKVGTRTYVEMIDEAMQTIDTLNGQVVRIEQIIKEI